MVMSRPVIRWLLLCLSVMLSISLDLMTTPLWTVHYTFLLRIIPGQNVKNKLSFGEEMIYNGMDEK